MKYLGVLINQQLKFSEHEHYKDIKFVSHQ